MLTTDSERPVREGQRARADHLVITEMVTNRARVLDVGCGDGGLLRLLEEARDVDGRGIEISREGVNHCVASGLSVIQGDADFDLDNYPDDAFDFAVLSLTIQATERPRHVLTQLLRIARHAIVSFPNFGHWRIRLNFMLNGRMPVNDSLPYAWYDTPNIHLCSVDDFRALCNETDARVERMVAFDSANQRLSHFAKGPLMNPLATQAVFLLSRRG